MRKDSSFRKVFYFRCMCEDPFCLLALTFEDDEDDPQSDTLDCLVSECVDVSGVPFWRRIVQAWKFVWGRGNMIHGDVILAPRHVKQLREVADFLEHKERLLNE